ncbi:putative TetR/AcrR family transcriptional regulator [Listeria floridensis FSL S10-1187]|uniref:TetR/AcrR family transcriptional regulator n=1 Tax=Listeria floridensis FSL S10-1187 TaxID=1265817 RepID=A0ABN0RG83_9LIST|nr:TetR/AcrR family transcriptional regulator [Listeria floridensis]EUJ32762.1 putative TetR/AcrR family transcriptional regulator [Listeria floridensis FSL S10-1187]
MNDKKRRILGKAKDIFRKKGYLLTSVADIVEASEISKGTFYNYFTSKEELAITIFKQEYSVLYQKLDRFMQDEDKSQKEKFRKAIELLVRFHIKNAEILNISFSQATLDDDFNQFLLSVRSRSFEWIKAQILLVYGEEMKPYLNDLAMTLTGMILLFVFVSSKQNQDQESDQISKAIDYVLNRMEAIVKDIAETGDILLTDEDMLGFTPDHLMIRKRQMGKLKGLIEDLLKKIELEKIADSDKWQYKETLNALLAELNNKETPRDFIIQGALLYLKQQVPRNLEREIIQLEVQVNGLL